MKTREYGQMGKWRNEEEEQCSFIVFLFAFFPLTLFALDLPAVFPFHDSERSHATELCVALLHEFLNRNCEEFL
jgi:hypothetical protein